MRIRGWSSDVCSSDLLLQEQDRERPMAVYLVQFLSGLASASALFLAASGLSIIFGVTRVVNFAHGSFYMLGAYFGYSLVHSLGGGALGFWVALLIASIAVGLVGQIGRAHV